MRHGSCHKASAHRHAQNGRSPQHDSSPDCANPQVKTSAALTAVYTPGAGVDWPLASSPQQTALPFESTAHACRFPALTVE
jgi:hypothetical protein